jgi:pyridinium-3,5-bisthiocarboxylic acid mononucleotide nickel chelatase
MKVLLFDPFAGASGDMTIGCLLDLGADPVVVREAIESLGCKLEISKEQKSHILTTRARVASDKRYQSFDEALSLLKNARIEPPARDRALKIIDTLANAESTVHGVPKEEARFHEIGALDALADIAGSCVALYTLEVEKVLSLPISVGGGFFQSTHGLLPVPGPATLEILRSHRIPWKGGPVDQELLTPTGAAIFANVVDQFLDSYPAIQAESVGYGAGSKDFHVPNALRGVIGQLKGHHLTPDQVVQLETNVDDVTGEVLGNLIDLLMQAGALDASIIPAVMKKGRPGNVISAIARQDDAEKLSRLIMKETGSLGIRVFPSVHRYVAGRVERTVTVEINGSVYQASVKVSRLGNAVLNIKPEFDDCKDIAAETGLSLREVIKKVEEVGRKDSLID